MPTSQPRNLTTIHTIIQTLNPVSLIDLGVGHGKTGVLVRESLDIMQSNYSPNAWKTQIYGIEVFPAYYNPLWDYAYDKVVVSDALTGLDSLPKVDMIVALDIWEHFEPSYADQVLDSALHQAKFLLIATPKLPLQQGAVLGNDAERHVSKWNPEDFKRVPHMLVTCTLRDWILLLSQNEIPSNLMQFSNLKRQITDSMHIVRDLWRWRHCNR